MLGAEFIQTLITHLQDIDNINKQRIFLQNRIPTVFVADLPLNILDESAFRFVLGHSATKWVCIALKNEKYNILECGFNFPSVDPQYIYKHYHLKKITCRNDAVQCLKMLEAYCDKCQRKIKISLE